MVMPPLDPVRASDGLPARAEIAIVGGGIVGVSAALFLAERGVPVVLCEKGAIGGEQSGRNWGWTRVMGRDPRELPLGIESLRLWRELNARTGGETGFRQSGIAYVCESDADIARHEAWLEHAKLFQLDSRLLGPEETDRLLPGATRKWRGALYTASDGRAEPQKAAPAIAVAARRAGAAILTNCAVRGLDIAGGRVVGVVTEKGRIACGTVVLAAGAWSRLFCGNHGVDLPQLKVLGSVMRTAPLQGAPEIAAGASNFAFRKRLDGGYTIAQRGGTIAEIVPDSFRLLRDFLPSLRAQRGELRLRIGKRFIAEWRLPRRWSLDAVTPFERVRVLDPEPSRRILDEALEILPAAFPVFKDAPILERWAGLVDVTPDAVPVIGPVAALPGLFLATGFSGHGFGIGPGAGRLVAEMVTGAKPAVDPAPYRFERFAPRRR
jgi:glycine/D-amino acid oxidase-like deaminating enzyme